ncbi:MAG: hypothetical protein WKH64_11160 [Chloroflexia bacterium]
MGGRVRTDSHPQGYRLDHGFQVLFTAYPAARRTSTTTRCISVGSTQER